MSWLDLAGTARTALRDPDALRAGADATQAARLVLTGCLGAAAFGAMLGGAWADVRVLYGAVKMPAVLVLPVLVTLPSLHRLAAAAEAPIAWSALTIEAALAIARFGLLLVAGVPLVWILLTYGAVQADVVRGAALIMLVALGVALRPLRLVPSEGVSALMATVLLAVTLGQTAWMLRPFVSAPGSEPVFVEDAGGFFVWGLIDPLYAAPDEPAERAYRDDGRCAL